MSRNIVWGDIYQSAERTASSFKKTLREVGEQAGEAAIRSRAENLARSLFADLDREDLNKPDVLAVVSWFLACIPDWARRLGAEFAEHVIHTNPKLRRTLAGVAIQQALSGLIEGADNGLRETIQREGITQQEAARALRKYLPQLVALRDKERAEHPETETGTHAEKKEIPVSDTRHGADTAPKTDHGKEKKDGKDPKVAAAVAAVHEVKEEHGVDLSPILKWEEPYAALMFLAVIHQAMVERRIDRSDKTLVGRAHKVVAGAGMLLKDGPELVRQHLPRNPNGKITMALVDAVRAKPLENVHANALIELMEFKYENTHQAWRLPPHIADPVDQFVDLHALKEFAKAWQAKLSAGEVFDWDKATMPAWMRQLHPGLAKVWNFGSRWNKRLLLGGIALVVIGFGFLGIAAINFIVLSLTESDNTVMWAQSWLASAIGLPMIFVARILVSLIDTQLTIAARAVQALPIALQRVLEQFKFKLPSERDKSVSQWANVMVGRENATMVTFITALASIVISVIGAAGMAMSLATPTLGTAGVAGALVVLALILKDWGIATGDSYVRRRLLLTMPAPSQQDLLVRTERAGRARVAAIASGIGAGLTFAAMLLVAFGGSALVIRNKIEATELATQRQLHKAEEEAKAVRGEQICAQLDAESIEWEQRTGNREGSYCRQMEDWRCKLCYE